MISCVNQRGVMQRSVSWWVHIAVIADKMRGLWQQIALEGEATAKPVCFPVVALSLLDVVRKLLGTSSWRGGACQSIVALLAVSSFSLFWCQTNNQTHWETGTCCQVQHSVDTQRWDHRICNNVAFEHHLSENDLCTLFFGPDFGNGEQVAGLFFSFCLFEISWKAKHHGVLMSRLQWTLWTNFLHLVQCQGYKKVFAPSTSHPFLPNAFDQREAWAKETLPLWWRCNVDGIFVKNKDLNFSGFVGSRRLQERTKKSGGPKRHPFKIRMPTTLLWIAIFRTLGQQSKTMLDIIPC